MKLFQNVFRLSQKNLPQSDSAAKKLSTWNTYLRLYRYASVYDWINFVVVGVLTTVAAVCQLFFMFQFSEAIDKCISYSEEMEHQTVSNSTKEVLKLGIYKISAKMIGIGIITFTCLYVAGISLSYSSSRQVYKMRKKLFETILNHDIAWYDLNQFGDFAALLSENFAKIEDGMGEKVVFFLYNELVFITCVVWSFILGWKLTLVYLIPLPVTIGVMLTIPNLSRKLSNKSFKCYAEAGGIAEEVLRNIKTVVSYDGQEKEIKNYGQRLLEGRKSNIKNNLFSGLQNGILWFMRCLGTALFWWYIFRLTTLIRDIQSENKPHAIEDILTILMTASFGSFHSIMGSIILEIFGIACGAADKIFKILDFEPKKVINSDGKVKLKQLKGSLVFDSVRFSYPSRKDVEVLKGLSMNVEPGETVALVGRSGCGKSTCIQLLERFYDPVEGKIYIDHTDARDLDVSWLRSQIGLVSQEPILFDATIAENIRFGKLTATQAEIEKAAKKAQVHTFISSLPESYETFIGERGMKLSGGQKQRIALARALIRKPSVILLDEATSALDSVSEAEVQAALDSVTGQCTTILVAHRLSTVKKANKIFVISEGKVVEEGTYSELIQMRGYFYKLEKSEQKQNEIAGISGRFDVQTCPTQNWRYSELEVEEFTKAEVSSNLENTDIISMEIFRMSKPEWIWILLGTVGSIGVGAGTCIYALLYISMFSNYSFGVTGENIGVRIRTKMFATILKQDMEWLDKRENGVGALCSRISSDGNAIQSATGLTTGILISAISNSLMCYGFACCYEWKLALVLTPYFVFVLISSILQERMTHNWVALKKKNLFKSSKVAMEALSNIRTVAAFGCEKLLLRLYSDEVLKYISRSRKIAHAQAVVMGIAYSLYIFVYACALFYGVVLILENDLDYEVILKVSILMGTGSRMIGTVIAFIPNIQSGIKASQSAHNLFMSKPKMNNSSDAPKKIWENGLIRYYEDVTFSYPTRPDISILKHLNLLVRPGKTVALVGRAGCGKSSIINLLQRFYDPLSGQISVDNYDIKHVDVQHHRANFGIVSQESNLFDRSIAENIAYGDNSRTVTMEEIIEVAKNANIHDFICSLPQGYETRLGTAGVQLSGGQKQRIAIARAMVRNPRTLVLDEATSALDNESEQIVQEALDKAKEGRTCITIAHRLTTIQNADLIYVIGEGKVLEMGNHDELMHMRGLYYKSTNL